MNELSLHILDICQNSISANSSLIELNIIEDLKTNTFQIEIIDDGLGMNEKVLSEVSDPFYTTRTTRKVGMGISLFKMAAGMANGYLNVKSKVNKGTTVKAVFQHNHIDRAPLGDIEDTIVVLILNERDIDICYNHYVNDNHYLIDTREIKKVLDGIPFTDYSVIQWIKQNINEGIKNLHKEVST